MVIARAPIAPPQGWLRILAHPHEDDAAHGTVGLGTDREHLSDDLVRAQVAAEAERARGAEGAGERAAHLARDADDVLLLLPLVCGQIGAGRFARHGDPHRLDTRAVAQLEQVLHESIGRGLTAGHLERRGRRVRFDRMEQLATYAADGSQIGLAALHRCREQLPPDFVIRAERAVLFGEQSAAVHRGAVIHPGCLPQSAARSRSKGDRRCTRAGRPSTCSLPALRRGSGSGSSRVPRRASAG